ncbi:MAG: hypothetical protein KID05_08465, partial [Pseudomonas sp.]|uniref:hypothetical protein n=1 Tax=Pseudomonas sp. TaxID=306 RepID=UPI002353DD0A
MFDWHPFRIRCTGEGKWLERVLGGRDAKSQAQKKGSSRITGKDALDLYEKEFAIPVTVRHPFDDLY